MSELLTTADAARLLGVSASFLEKDRVTTGRIRFYRLGKKRGVRYRLEDLLDFLQLSEFSTTSSYSGDNK